MSGTWRIRIRAELPLLAHRRTDVYRLERLGGR